MEKGEEWRGRVRDVCNRGKMWRDIGKRGTEGCEKERGVRKSEKEEDGEKRGETGEEGGEEREKREREEGEVGRSSEGKNENIQAADISSCFSAELKWTLPMAHILLPFIAHDSSSYCTFLDLNNFLFNHDIVGRETVIYTRAGCWSYPSAG
eukprot:TRINITY_DN156_c0_g1_i5.p2 TRINITY_DN156_c0_g1~~TRINITY_DN156_c0_g1_i5.p2  ORF type:complete len:152 (+),score=33.08 TRINITY_DN156_c0_g1_i5:70-525(+)